MERHKWKEEDWEAQIEERGWRDTEERGWRDAYRVKRMWRHR